MGIRTFKPTSPARRFYTASDFAEITKSEPEKSLIEKQNSTGGRNNHGRITSRFRGGGHKQRYRLIDFKRDKIGVPALVAAIEYDPNRTSRIALLHYVDGEKSYILAPDGLAVGSHDRREPQRRHQAWQQPHAAVHPAGHVDPQRRAPQGQGRADLPVRRHQRAAHGQGRRCTPRCAFPAVRSARCTSTAARPSARSRTSSTRTWSWARPAARAGSAGARTTAVSR
jgi:hypothetical protein